MSQETNKPLNIRLDTVKYPEEWVWLDNQSNKSMSVKLLINMARNLYGNGDIYEAILTQRAQDNDPLTASAQKLATTATSTVTADTSSQPVKTPAPNPQVKAADGDESDGDWRKMMNP